MTCVTLRLKSELSGFTQIVRLKLLLFFIVKFPSKPALTTQEAEVTENAINSYLFKRLINKNNLHANYHERTFKQILIFLVKILIINNLACRLTQWLTFLQEAVIMAVMATLRVVFATQPESPGSALG